MLKYIPDDINIEDILSYLPEDSYRVSISGLHKRNSYKDIISYELSADGKIVFYVGRNSIYNSLPEYMFHPINRFDNIPEREHKERFAEEYARQEMEKENARKFFSAIDVLLLDIRVKVKEIINKYASENRIMQAVIADSLTETEKDNRFIKRIMPFIPNCKRIRGNRTLISMILRKVLCEEGLSLVKDDPICEFEDKRPKYNNSIDDFLLDSIYVGNQFCEKVTKFTVRYWPDDESTEHFCNFMKDLEDFRIFVQDYFFSVEEELCFDVVKDYPALRLSDDIIYNYLNYNANI